MLFCTSWGITKQKLLTCSEVKLKNKIRSHNNRTRLRTTDKNFVKNKNMCKISLKWTVKGYFAIKFKRLLFSSTCIQKVFVGMFLKSSCSISDIFIQLPIVSEKIEWIKRPNCGRLLHIKYLIWSNITLYILLLCTCNSINY